MKVFARWWVALALALACGGALAQATDVAGQQDVQLRRLIVDFHIGDLMRMGMQQGAQGIDTADSKPLQDMIDQLVNMPPQEIAEAVTPALRGSVSEDDARKICDFLETRSGRAMVQWMLEKESHRSAAEPVHPVVDKKEVEAFKENGGLDAMLAFAALLRTPEYQKKVMLALVHHATRPQSD